MPGGGEINAISQSTLNFIFIGLSLRCTPLQYVRARVRPRNYTAGVGSRRWRTEWRLLRTDVGGHLYFHGWDGGDQWL